MKTKNIRTALLAVALVCAFVNMAVPGMGASLENDSVAGISVTQLRDVEIVGVKQMPEKELEAVTEIDEAEIKAFNINAVRNISEVTPNFYIPMYGSRMTSSIYVRGLGSRIDAPVVGLNVDNVPYLNKDNYDFDIADISRIEVLRGTRSLLNGRNSMGGQINITTMSPWDYEGVRFTGEYGRGNSGRVNLSWYGRLSALVATSVSGQFGSTDGFYKNEYDNSDCGKERQGSLRWKLSWHPGSRWSLSNVAGVTMGKQTGYPYASLETGRIDYNDTTSYRRTSFTDGLTVSYTGKRMIATSVTSVQYLDDDMHLDQDFLPEDYFILQQKRKEWAWTQDLFAKGTRGKYDWLLGVFGFYKTCDMQAPVTFKDYGISTLIENNVNRVLPAGMRLEWDSRRMLLNSSFDMSNGGFAVYHQSTVTLGRVSLRGGLRWDIEHVGLDYVSNVNTSCTMYRSLPTGMEIPLAQRPIIVDDKGSMSQTFSELLPQLLVSVDLGRGWDVYASVAKGYKAGGYNTQMFSDVLQQQLMEQVGMSAAYDIEKMLTYKPEKSWTYEVGAEAVLCDGRLRLGGVAYCMSVRDQQLTVFPEGQTTGRCMTNAGRTRSIGGEAEINWQATGDLRLSAAYGYTHATFTQYNDGRTDFEGKHLPYAPSQTMFVSAHYDVPLSFGDFTPAVDVYTRGAGDIWWDDDNTERQKFYATLNASLSVNHKLGSLSLWGENLTNTRYDTFYFESIGNKFVQHARPWAVGVTLRLNIEM